MKFSNNKPEPASFQIAPMIDVVFLLLIFFIVSWNVSANENKQNKEIQLVSSQDGKTTNSYEHSIVIEVFKEGKIKIGKKSYTKESLKQQMEQTFRLFPDKPITIWADKEATIEQAFTIRNICTEIGLTQVNIAARQKL